MYFVIAQIFIIVVLIFLILLFIGILLWSNPSQSLDELNQINYFDSDLKTIRDIIMNDSYLHRLLMIEIIGKNLSTKTTSDNKPFPLPENISEIISESESTTDICSGTGCHLNSDLISENITFKKISDGVNLLGRSMIRFFGGVISQRITLLMHQRNTIIKEYYTSMLNIVCHNGTCVHVVDISSSNCDIQASRVIHPLTSTDPIFPDNLLSINEASDHSSETTKEEPSEVHIARLDITTITLRKLDNITREIADSISSAFHVRDLNYSSNDPSFSTTKKYHSNEFIPVTSNKISLKRPILHYEKLLNLMIMYDKELLNQAKAYALKNFDISMNCSQSSLELAYHISDELTLLIREGSNFNVKDFRREHPTLKDFP